MMLRLTVTANHACALLRLQNSLISSLLNWSFSRIRSTVPDHQDSHASTHSKRRRAAAILVNSADFITIATFPVG